MKTKEIVCLLASVVMLPIHTGALNKYNNQLNRVWQELENRTESLGNLRCQLFTLDTLYPFSHEEKENFVKVNKQYRSRVFNALTYARPTPARLNAQKAADTSWYRKYAHLLVYYTIATLRAHRAHGLKNIAEHPDYAHSPLYHLTLLVDICFNTLWVRTIVPDNPELRNKLTSLLHFIADNKHTSSWTAPWWDNPDDDHILCQQFCLS